jgi:Cytochrome c oxidase subunit IV
MRVNSNLFWILAAFFWAADALYIIWNLVSFNDPVPSALTPIHPVEWVGTVAIGLSGILSLLIAFYVTATRRAQGGELPEDRLDAEIDDGDPEVGYFSPWSWWPMVLALGTALVFLGLAIGIWLSFIGAPIAILAVIGWYYEYYRGNFAR